MIDLRILTIRDLLPIVKVAYAAVQPLSILITGDSLNQTSEVMINDSTAPEFMVLSANQLVAQVPLDQRNSVLRKVACIANVATATRRSLLHFEVGSSIAGITGLEKLIQAYVKLLIQSPGSDKFRPNEGGGLLKLVGRNVSQGDTQNLQASVMGAITRTRDQLTARQGSDRSIPPDERLLTASAEAVGFDPLTSTLSARVALAAVSGAQAVANLTL